MNYAELGYLRAAAVAPALALGEPATNAERIVAHLEELNRQHVAVALFPELAVTGYSCEDLFFTRDLMRANVAALAHLAAASKEFKDLVAVVGAPYLLRDGRLLNCAAVIAGGRVHAMVPKTSQPNYAEFYEKRWFVSGAGVDEQVEDPSLGSFRVCTDQLLVVGGAQLGIEICEDLWGPEPPGIRHCLAGAELILNLSASNELVAKADYRRDLVHMTSARGLCAYLYASSGPLESTKDLVFGGHLIASENGQPLAESARFRFDAQAITVDFDLDKLRHDRMRNTTFSNTPRAAAHQVVDVLGSARTLSRLDRAYPQHPFVPADETQFNARAQEILEIQSTGLARRMLAAGVDDLVIGLSGGLDSTLAFLVCLEALDRLRGSHTIHALTMPGPGTSEHTLSSVRKLCEVTGVDLTEIPIHDAVQQHLADIGHDKRHDVVFENVQARERTQLLFDWANKVGGIVVGTGDLSELALGWCTFNADHMAGYNVNASVPKTMIAYLVRWYAVHRAEPAMANVLERVLDTPISPELIAPDEKGKITQETEAIIGPYELHDFFLFHYLRNGFSAAKIFHLARLTFEDAYDAAEIRRWLKVFYQRFFSQQFKRTTLPPGPKVGTVSLSPRGDWRMPDEAQAARIVADIDKLH